MNPSTGFSHQSTLMASDLKKEPRWDQRRFAAPTHHEIQRLQMVGRRSMRACPTLQTIFKQAGSGRG